MSERAARFDALYRARPDPWAFETSDYERAKYAATLAALPAGHFAHAIEVGCSIGVFTRALVDRCKRVTALDVSAVALADARTRCAGLPVDFQRAEVPAQWPDGRFDLVVLSEVLYFLEPSEIGPLAQRVAGAAAPGAAVLLVNYLGPCDRPLDGAAAAQAFIAAARELGFSVRDQRIEPEYRIDLLAAPTAEAIPPARAS